MSKKVIIINYILIGILFAFNIFACVYFLTIDKTDIIFDNNILKVVEIKVSDDEVTWGYATGFFIDNNGTILTNKHVVYKSSDTSNFNFIYVRLADVDEWLDAKIINISETDDLATIKIDKQNTQYFSFTNNISNGEIVYTIGNPNGFGLSFISGVVSSKLRNIVYNGQTISAIQTSLVINEGNSGGPVFKKDGDLVGIISFRLKDKYGEVIQGVGFALPYATINNFLSD